MNSFLFPALLDVVLKQVQVSPISSVPRTEFTYDENTYMHARWNVHIFHCNNCHHRHHHHHHNHHHHHHHRRRRYFYHIIIIIIIIFSSTIIIIIIIIIIPLSLFS